MSCRPVIVGPGYCRALADYFLTYTLHARLILLLHGIPSTHVSSCLEAIGLWPRSEYKFNSDEEEEPETRYGMALTMDV